MSTIVRRMVLLAVAGCLVLAGCAQPGQLGSPPETAAPAPVTPEPPAGPVELGRGTVRDPLEIRTPGSAVFSVRTVVVPPGGTTGWHQHPGTETSILKSGSITLVRQDACEPAVFGAGDAVFIPDALPHLARNDGVEPAELVVTYLLAPDAPDRSDVPPACPGV
ncbi:cupin domain-containing protein [Pseudonocardia sp. H11422]|uniref:cupin domain-containing protein n=1 Tax=Pseudonocardia sp. H11422 TaxID=2835866 RepID=UPI001BDD9094|nr:cupin domain-containing protein [Pseudonocardia sp. H11422]